MSKEKDGSFTVVHTINRRRTFWDWLFRRKLAPVDVTWNVRESKPIAFNADAATIQGALLETGLDVSIDKPSYDASFVITFPADRQVMADSPRIKRLWIDGKLAYPRQGDEPDCPECGSPLVWDPQSDTGPAPEPWCCLKCETAFATADLTFDPSRCTCAVLGRGPCGYCESFRGIWP